MKKKWIKVLVLVAVLGALATGGAYAAYRGYKSFRQAKLVQQAKDFWAKSDPRNAVLCLRRALGYNSRDIEACRLMAEIGEAAGNQAAMVWRGRVVELKPDSLDDRLALVKVAMTFGDLTTATNALAGVNDAGKQTAEYHNSAGGVMAAVNQVDAAEMHFREASRLEPANALYQLSLAIVHLSQTNALTLVEARSRLDSIASNPTNTTLRCIALRALAADAIRQNNFKAALDLSLQLLQQTNSVFNDRLLRLSVLKQSRSDQFEPSLTAFQKEAGTNATSILNMGLWHLQNLGPASALEWLHTLPAEVRDRPSASMLIAECLVAKRDWVSLQTTLDRQNWEEFEFLRRAMKVRALRGQNLSAAAKGEWELAIKASNNKYRNLLILMGFAVRQQWLSEVEEILWAIVRSYPNERWAVQSLTTVLCKEGRTRPLLQLYTEEFRRSPKDLSIKNNLAMSALLLEANELKPHELAKEIFEKAPTNAAFASTYAYSLHVQSRNDEALKVMQSLSPKQLEDPSIAGYYGIILRAAGNAEKARVYINWGLRSQMLLPEERKLFERAKSNS